MWLSHNTEFLNAEDVTVMFTGGLAYQLGNILPKIKDNTNNLFLYVETSRSTNSFNIATSPSNLSIAFGLIIGI